MIEFTKLAIWTRRAFQFHLIFRHLPIFLTTHFYASPKLDIAHKGERRKELKDTARKGKGGKGREVKRNKRKKRKAKKKESRSDMVRVGMLSTHFVAIKSGDTRKTTQSVSGGYTNTKRHVRFT